MSREVLQQALGYVERNCPALVFEEIKAALAQPDNTSKQYEELRSIIDGGSESFTHNDAVQYLKDKLAPLKWIPEDMAYRPGGLPQSEHPEQMAQLGWQYVECPACGSEGARAFPKPNQEPVALPNGKRLILVDGTFDELMYWLDRCEDKGHLENCYDLVEPWANFKYEDYTSPPQRQPLTDEEINELNLPPSGTATVRDIVRLIEAKHNIGDKT